MQRPPCGAVVFIGTYAHRRTALAAIGNYGPANITAKSPASVNAPAGSAGRLTLSGCRRLLDRVQHPMARDRVVERGREMRSLAIVARETRVRLGDVDGRAVQRREPVLRRHGQDLGRGLRTVAATYGKLEDLGLATV